MERPPYAPDLPVRGENALPATSGNRLPGALIAGALAGPILIVSSFVQGLVRDGFQFAADPPSALALGSAGVIQQATFVVSGLLLARGGWGLRGLGFGRWVPRLLVVLGTSLAAAGVFRMDPAFGFPPGTPPGIGASVSWHAAIHGVLFPIGFLALVGAAVIAGRRYAKEGRAGMFWVTCLAAGSSLTLSLWPNLAGNPDGRFGPMWVGVTIGYAWTSLLFADVIRSRRKTHVR
jgi:hypothetical protein